MIKISPADKVFSHYIRTRDKQCLRCHSPVKFNNGLPVSHQASHYFGKAEKAEILKKETDYGNATTDRGR